MLSSQLLLGTTSGVYAVASGQQTARLLALKGALVTHLAAAPLGAAAAVPRLACGPGELHALYPFAASLPAEQACGMHLLRPRGDSGSGAGADEPAFSSEHVWAGDARSCCIWDAPPPGGSGGGGQQEVGLAVGTEPADVFTSVDSGRSWSGGTGSFAAAPSREKWSFPAPPHQPHVLSVERLPGGGGDGGEGGEGSGRLVAGIEVGGVLVGPDAGGAGPAPAAAPAPAPAERSTLGGSSAWEERNQGIYVDVHSCRVDPHQAAHWLAVTGRGVYETHTAGASWHAVSPATWAGRYTVGLAINPQRQGEVLVAAGDRPPGIGVHMYRSTDGGASWRDITGAVFNGHECAEAKGDRTPVPYFWGGQALVGTDTGHVLASTDAERQQWRPVCRVPAPVLCMALPGQSPSSIMH